MTTQLKYARDGIITKEMRYVAEQENVDSEWLINEISRGTIIIPANINHKKLKPVGIGKGLKTKINANIGASKIRASIAEELKKFNKKQLEIINNPEKYIGIAAKKAEMICDYWKKELKLH